MNSTTAHLSSFARKERMTLEYKDVAYEAVDGLLKSNHAALRAVNGRVEVPALVDGDIVVVNSADIVADLDYRYPSESVYPDAPAARVHARAWERVADTFVDPILVDISYWKWAQRPTRYPTGSLKPHVPTFAMSTTRSTPSLLHVSSSAALYRLLTLRCFHTSRVQRQWTLSSRRRITPISGAGSRTCIPADLCGRLERARTYVVTMKDRDIEKQAIFWRGDRIEWILARGFHAWFFNEIKADRVAWPGQALPAPTKG